jgi:hypothetical protein
MAEMPDRVAAAAQVARVLLLDTKAAVGWDLSTEQVVAAI